MGMMQGMLKMLPKSLKDKMTAPMLSKDRIEFGSNHPAIKMNLTNLLICAENCGTCPSFSNLKDEALYCASGKSSAVIEENGCNCVSCSVYELCSVNNTAYFCIHGNCGAKDDRSDAAKLTDLTSQYLQRFVFHKEYESEDNDLDIEEEIVITDDHDVTLRFEGEKDVETHSNVAILQASLNAGIPHTHVCGGRARCSTCRVLVTEGVDNCRPRNARETRLAKIKGFSPEVRLACQTTTIDTVSLRRLVLDEKDISEAISQGRVTIGEVGREVEATILFSDIRSFTSFSEHALPYDIIHILNRYFETIGEIIDENGGYIDKYMGDGIMVIFGLNKDMEEDHAYLAMKTALKMQQAISKFNKYLKDHFDHEFRIGIGIHTGSVIVGNLGFSKKKEFTAIGDAVNTASRIESLNKRTGTLVLASEDTFKKN